MTQKRFIEYRASVNSFPLSEARAGIIPPGRYRGFDTMQQGSGTAIAVEILHTAIAGIKYTDDDNTRLSDYHGCMVSPHGTVIYLDDTLEFTVDANSSGSDRYDLVYMEYSWAKVSGGSSATFTLLKGTPGAGSAPAVPDNQIDVPVGVIYVPDGASVFADLTWTPARIPDLGAGDIIEQHPQLDERYAIKDEENTFTENNIFEKLIELGYNSAGTITIASHKLVVGKSGNTIILVDTVPVVDYIDGIIPEVGEEFQPGTKLTLFFLISSSTLTLKAYSNPNSGFYGPPFTDRVIGTYEVVELTYLGEFLGAGSGSVWIITSPSWIMSKDFYTPTEIPITTFSAIGIGSFTAGAYQPGGYVIGKIKHLYGNITGPNGVMLARESDVEICTLPTLLRPVRTMYVGATIVSSYRDGHPTVVFRRVAKIEASGAVTILAGATDDNADLYLDGGTYNGIYLDGISYT